MPPPILFEISENAVRLAQVFYGVTIPLMTLATATFVYRMLKSARRKSFWSDTCITIGWALAVADWGLLMPQMFLTPGVKETAAVFNGFRGAYLAIAVWGMSLAFIKAAIGFTLLHIRQTFWFSVFIWSNIFLAAGYGFGNFWFSIFSCRPMRASWGDFPDPPETVSCTGPDAQTTAALIGAVVSISTDIVLSLAPIVFLWNLNLPRRERIVIGVLMSLGVVAAATSLVKILAVEKFAMPGQDAIGLNITISTWTILELILGIIAACTPFCKPVFEQCLWLLGLSLHPTAASNSNSKKQTPVRAQYRRATDNDTFQSQISAGRSGFRDGETDEVPLTNGIEMQAGLAPRPDANGRIYKRTEVHVKNEELREDNRADGWKKYTP
ncbi:hypothetical protein PG991_012287 [Apiospora marii]|uniref:Rhodopsin domain-containing protein n=1 Tax=Apiospora marii TaxID=335849 RepID=A0ABR1R9F4_9PEZI